jgi:hypothetical protein
MLRHEGEWDGIYRHIDTDGSLLDEHRTWTRCEFPTNGPHAYIQHNRLTWADGRILERTLCATFRDGMLHWDTDRLQGHGWETREGTVMLRLDYKQEPGLWFIEMISLSDDGRSRARTWQWFKDGNPLKRTLCDEWRLA